MFFFTLLPFSWAGWLSSIPFVRYNTTYVHMMIFRSIEVPSQHSPVPSQHSSVSSQHSQFLANIRHFPPDICQFPDNIYQFPVNILQFPANICQFPTNIPSVPSQHLSGQELPPQLSLLSTSRSLTL
jgi:hypothetical protein